MSYDTLVVLIPSHSLEDFPTDLPEEQAAGLLNAFAVVWHPALLASAGVIPTWHRADDPPEQLDKRLVIVPACCDDWLPGGWAEHARMHGAVVLAGLSERDELLRAALEPLDPPPSVDPELAADFLALGTCYLQLELLTRHMHYFSNLDEAHLQREAVAAAEAAVAGDGEAARARLQTCFEVLQEARERFYPVDCYLLDLCLLIPRLADENLERTLAAGTPVSLLAAAEDLEQIAADKPHLIESLKQAWTDERADVLGGEWQEGPATLLPLESVLWQFRRGHRAFHRLLGRTPTTWGRRRFGFSVQVPQILDRHGCRSAFHVALDDGLYPDAEQSKIRWEGCDGSAVDAISRIPLAADGATSYLRFSNRMAESMEQDQVAAVLFARWPEVKSVWFEDFRRMHRYAPVLGRFVTFHEFFDRTDSPGRFSRFEAKEYLTPYLIQAVARQEPDPIGRFADHLRRRQQFDAASWFAGMSAVLTGRPVASDPDDEVEALIEQAGPDAVTDTELISRAETRLEEFAAASSRQLAEIIMSGAGDQAGFLLLNPLAFTRRVSVDLPDLKSPPAVGGAIKAVQFELPASDSPNHSPPSQGGAGGGKAATADVASSRKSVTVEIPGSGFVWVPADGLSDAPVAKSSTATVEESILRNEFFEVYVNEETGGIARIKEYGRSPNRLSQQVAFRFPRERAFADEETGETVKTHYSEMRCRSLEVTCRGPALGEIVTEGDILDQQDDSRLAGFRQRVRVWRGRPVVEIDLELDLEKLPDGDPWNNYYAARFAWNDSTASLTRSVQQGAHSFVGERIESPHYVEIATEEQRTTILPVGLPFHRKTGMRMIDSLLVAAGETRRQFRFVIAIDQNYPLQAALDAMVPVTVVPTESGPPRVGTSGWFFHLNAPNVQVLQVLPLLDEQAEPRTGEPRTGEPHSGEPHSGEAAGGGAAGGGFALRLLETEGRRRSARLRCFRAPAEARQRDFRGRTLADLRTEDDCVLIEMAAYEIADIEVRWCDGEW